MEAASPSVWNIATYLLPFRACRSPSLGGDLRVVVHRCDVTVVNHVLYVIDREFADHWFLVVTGLRQSKVEFLLTLSCSIPRHRIQAT